MEGAMSDVYKAALKRREQLKNDLEALDRFLRFAESKARGKGVTARDAQSDGVAAEAEELVLSNPTGTPIRHRSPTVRHAPKTRQLKFRGAFRDTDT
jgi:hypothetical protein